MGRTWLVLVAGLVMLSLSTPAIAKTKLVPESNPQVVAMNGRAIALYNEGEYDGALSILDEIVRRLPESGLGYANRGGVYSRSAKMTRR